MENIFNRVERTTRHSSYIINKSENNINGTQIYEQQITHSLERMDLSETVEYDYNFEDSQYCDDSCCSYSHDEHDYDNDKENMPLLQVPLSDISEDGQMDVRNRKVTFATHKTIKIRTSSKIPKKSVKNKKKNVLVVPSSLLSPKSILKSPDRSKNVNLDVNKKNKKCDTPTDGHFESFTEEATKLDKESENKPIEKEEQPKDERNEVCAISTTAPNPKPMRSSSNGPRMCKHRVIANGTCTRCGFSVNETKESKGGVSVNETKESKVVQMPVVDKRLSNAVIPRRASIERTHRVKTNNKLLDTGGDKLSQNVDIQEPVAVEKELSKDVPMNESNGKLNEDCVISTTTTNTKPMRSSSNGPRTCKHRVIEDGTCTRCGLSVNEMKDSKVVQKPLVDKRLSNAIIPRRASIERTHHVKKKNKLLDTGGEELSEDVKIEEPKTVEKESENKPIEKKQSNDALNEANTIPPTSHPPTLKLEKALSRDRSCKHRIITSNGCCYRCGTSVNKIGDLNVTKHVFLKK